MRIFMYGSQSVPVLGADIRIAEDEDDLLSLLRRYPFDIVMLVAAYVSPSFISSVKTLCGDRGLISLVHVQDPLVRVSHLEHGADYVLTLPVHARELGAVCKVVLRKTTPNRIVTVGEVVIDLSAEHVTRNGEAVHLTVREWQVLSILAARRGRRFSIDALAEQIYMDQPHVSPRSIDVFLCKLRKKLGRIIQCEWNRGHYIPPEETARVEVKTAAA